MSKHLYILSSNLLSQAKIEGPRGHKLFNKIICNGLPPLLVLSHQWLQDCNQLLLELPTQHLATLIILCGQVSICL